MLIMSHPTTPEFHPVHHPSYIDFFEEVLAETTDPLVMEAQFEERFATDSGTGTCTAPATPTTGCTRSTWVLGQPRPGAPRRRGRRRRRSATVRRLGFRPASTMSDALEIASDVVGRQPTITRLQEPAAVDGRRDVTVHR